MATSIRYLLEFLILCFKPRYCDGHPSPADIVSNQQTTNRPFSAPSRASPAQDPLAFQSECVCLSVTRKVSGGRRLEYSTGYHGFESTRVVFLNHRRSSYFASVTVISSSFILATSGFVLGCHHTLIIRTKEEVSDGEDANNGFLS